MNADTTEHPTDQAVADDFADIESFRAEFLGSDAEKAAATDQYAKGRAQDLSDIADTIDGYTSKVDALRARAFAIRKRYRISR